MSSNCLQENDNQTARKSVYTFVDLIFHTHMHYPNLSLQFDGFGQFL